MDRGAWRAVVRGVAESQTRLKWLNTEHQPLLPEMWFESIFSHSMSYHFTLLIVSFDAEDFKFLCNSVCFYFRCLFLWRLIQEATAKSSVMRLSPMLSSENFIVLTFTFRLLIHFELIFVYGIRWTSNIILFFFQHHSFECGYPVFSTAFIEKRLSFPHWMVLAHFSKIIWPHKMKYSFLSSFFYSTDLYVCLYYTPHCFDLL